jgi:hypothetical protein
MAFSFSSIRKSLRIPLRIPLRVRMWRFGVPEQHAECINVSAGGIYFATGSSFHEGDRVEIDLRMPEAIVGRPSLVHCEGRVVRVKAIDPGSRILGVGVEIEKYRKIEEDPEAKDAA